MSYLDKTIIGIEEERLALWDKVDAVRIPLLAYLGILRQNIDTFREFLEYFDLEEFLRRVQAMTEKNDFFKGIEEYWRRQLVAFGKAAGTLIREEEIRRQALTAEINLPRAQRIRDTIRELMEKTFPMEKVSEKVSELTKGPVPAAELIGPLITDLLKDILWRFGLSLPTIGLSSEAIMSTLQDLNAMIEQVVNKIIADISREGVYYASITPMSLSPTVGENVWKFPNAYSKAVHVVEFLHVVKKVGEEKGIIKGE